MERGNSSSVDGGFKNKPSSPNRRTDQHKTCREHRMSYNLKIAQGPMFECEIRFILRLSASATL